MRVFLVILLLVGIASAAQRCCPDIGCFTDNEPYDGQPLPTCIEKIPPKYTMFTRSNRDAGQTLTPTSIPSVYNNSTRTVIITHGWQADGDMGSLATMKNAFLDREDINVVILDWAKGAANLWYPQAAANTRSIGAYTALVVDNLARNRLVRSGVWCIGHSLGAHVCGHTGMRTTVDPLARVTGLDPAGPWFQNSEDRTVGLNPTSALFVDVIHTDITLGTLRDLGHIDFYPNGGRNQPGCIGLKDNSAPEEMDNKSVFLGCSHGRAVSYMIESIRSDCFVSKSKCTDYEDITGSCTDCEHGWSDACAIMGYGADYGFQKSGLFYVPVDSSKPYCTN